MLYHVAFLGLASTMLAMVKGVCYKPGGTEEQNGGYKACNLFNPSNSACCATDNDACLPNGLCHWVNPASNDDATKYTYWREGCSNSSWPSDVCLTGVCPESNVSISFPLVSEPAIGRDRVANVQADLCKNIDNNGNAVMTPCSNTSDSLTWCCGQNNTDCCGKGAPTEYTLKPLLRVVSTSSTSGTSSAPIATTTNSSPDANATTPHVPQTGLSSGAKAGIGVGAAVGALAVLGAVGLCFYRRRRQQKERVPARRHSQDMQVYERTQAQDAELVVPVCDAKYASRGETSQAELASLKEPGELEGNNSVPCKASRSAGEPSGDGTRTGGGRLDAEQAHGAQR